MDRRTVLLLALLGLLVAALFGLSVAVDPGEGPIEPGEAGGIQLLDGILAHVPGLGRSLDPDEVSAAPAACFGAGRFEADTVAGPCRLTVPDGVDRLALDGVSPGCIVAVTGQDDVADHELDAGDPGDAGDGGELRVALSGNGATVELRARGPGARCEARLVD
jgi:hypothetical protein